MLRKFGLAFLIRLTLLLVLAIVSIGLASATCINQDSASPECIVSPIIIPYLDTGYKFKVVSFDEDSGFEHPDFDDTDFSVGDAGFGTLSGGCFLNNPTEVKTTWPLNTDILLRKNFNLQSGAANLKVSVAIDNDVQVFINGHDISGGLQIHEGCPTRDIFVFTAPNDVLVTGTNLIAVRGRDRGELSYLDVQVTVETSAKLVSIAVNPENPTIPLGQTQQFIANGAYSDSSKKDITATATWSSSNTTVGTVDATTGLFIALAPGTAIVNATNGSVIGSAIVIVEHPPNLIKNPGFESGISPWIFSTNGTGKFTLSPPGYEGNNAANIVIYSGGMDVQLYQNGISLEPHARYRLRFAAKSATGHDMSVMVLKQDSPFTSYGLDQMIYLNEDWGEFSTEFTTKGFTGMVNDARLMFYIAPFAPEGDIYYIDDVRLEKVVDLVGDWHFDGDARDSSGNRNDGTIYGGTAFVEGVRGKALSFDGVDDYVQIPVLSGTTYTLEAWIMPNVLNGGIIGNDDTSWRGKSLFLNSDGRIYIHNCHPQTCNDIYSTRAISTGIWNQVVASVNAGTATLYINGVASGEGYPVEQYGLSWWIGRGWITGFEGINYFNGLIDEVRVYNRALSADEIRQQIPTEITVVSPNGGENWARGLTRTISWTYSGSPGANVKIELLKSGEINRVIESSAPVGNSGSGSYNWLINSTQTSGSDYKVMVTSITNSTYTDTSNNNFTISKPMIGVDINITGIPVLNKSTKKILAADYRHFTAGDPYNITITRISDSLEVYADSGFLTGGLKQTIPMDWTPQDTSDYLVAAKGDTIVESNTVTIIDSEVVPPVPELSTIVLMSTGLIGLFGLVRWNKKRVVLS